MPRDEIGVLVADVEVDVIESEALDLIVVRARHDVARCQFGARIVIGHVAMPGDRVLQYAALAAHRLGDQEILDLQIIEAGRVELHHLHVGDAAARAPRHRDAVAGRSEEHTSELQSLMRISYAVFCLKQKHHYMYLTTYHL